jgi:UDP-N-acetyl-D-mannosaminuronate dehydrogenase
LRPVRRDRSTAGMNLVIGLGEIGRPLVEVLSRVHPVEGIDLPPRNVAGPIHFMHVCYPGNIPDFPGETAKYVRRYEPAIVVIHSTVPVGTTRAVEAVVSVPVLHSPVRGKHADMVEELLRYVKFVGGTDPNAVAQAEAHFQCAGMKTRRLSSPEATELAKLTETTYLGLLIAFAQDVDRMARATRVPYDDVASFYEEIGYLPPVRYFPGIIGGHCVMPNVALLKRTFESRLLDAVEWSNELRKAQG